MTAKEFAEHKAGVDVWDNLPFAQFNQHEAFADAFATYHLSPSELRSRYPEWVPLVEGVIKKATMNPKPSSKSQIDYAKHLLKQVSADEPDSFSHWEKASGTKVVLATGGTYHARMMPRTSTRPIPLPLKSIEIFVDYELIPGLVKWLKRRDPDSPIGDVSKILSEPFFLDTVMGDRIVVNVTLGAKASSVKGAAALAGKWRASSKEVFLYVNGALSPKDILEPTRQMDRLSPISQCTSLGCLPYALFNLLKHELTHAADVLEKIQYDPDKVQSEGEAAWGPYVNSPSEVRAFMREIVDDAENMARTIGPHVEDNQDLVSKVLQLSTTWTTIEKHLTDQNKRLVMKAVYDALDRSGLLKSAKVVLATGGMSWDHARMMLRVAARYKQKKTVKTQEGKERTVYVYSERQIALRNAEKAKKVEKLKSSIEKIRAKVKKDLRSDDPAQKLTALAVALIDHTYERVGNDDSAAERGHFGVTGWQRKHLSFGKGGVSISYTGKSGVKHTKKVTDESIKKALRDAYEAIEDEDAPVFEWEGGKVTAEKVNAYLKPFGVTAKDLRGFHANREMAEKLKAARKSGGELPTDKKERTKILKAEFKKALAETAEAVGHEAATLRSQYLVPGLEEQYAKNGTVLDKVASADFDFLRAVVLRYLFGK